jgi:transposase
MEKSSILGIDIAQDTFDVALIIEQKYVCGKFANNEPGFIALAAWLKKKDCVELHACMESTGPYGLSLANFLFESGFKVSIITPFSGSGKFLSDSLSLDKPLTENNQSAICLFIITIYNIYGRKNA